MIIDKLQGFWTAEEQEALVKYDAQLQETIQAKRANAGEYGTIIYNLLMQQNELQKAVNDRYNAHFEGDINAIYDDIIEVVEAITKQDYLARQKQIKQLTQGATDKAISKLTKQGFLTCYNFILGCIKPQLNALAFYGSDEGIARAIVEKKAEEFYKKPANLEKCLERLAQDITEVNSAQDGFKLTPTSPMLTGIYTAINRGDTLEQYVEQKKKYNFNQRLEVMRSDEGTTLSIVTMGKKKDGIRVTKQNFSISFKNVPHYVEKFFTRFMQAAVEQVIIQGQVKANKNKVTFPYSDFKSVYRDYNSFKRAILDASDPLRSISIKSIGKEVNTGNLFTNVGTENNSAAWAILNPNMDWGLITKFYMSLPNYYYELQPRAAVLLRFIFTMARTNADKLKEKGYLVIGYRAVHNELGLPGEIKANNPKRDIKDVIHDLAEQINEKHVAVMEATDILNIECCDDPKAKIKEFLDNGYYKVNMSGEYTARYIDIASKREQNEEENAKKAEAKKQAYFKRLAKKKQASDASLEAYPEASEK